MTHNSQGTTTARPKLDDVAFEAFIRARRPASPIWSMSGLDGYLTALIIGPRFIDPRQWIPELTSPDALNLPMETTEHRAVQTIVAEYNRISASLSETPKDPRPKFTRIDDQTFDPFDWISAFCEETSYAPKLWQPVLRGHAVTGDIIAPIRKLGEAKRKATRHDAAEVAEALVNIGTHFMPKRAKQKF
ncbi:MULTISPECIES: UPF0149 family protein [Rhizobium]|uniref:UPF0149 family protein n=1 Tax=Rhizobium TaxID=379 RepID=UPI000BBD988B|nr:MULTISPECIES: UPF0149 family protein [Rhizobium]PCK83173.1 YecA family protein [Rhizobium sophoriradicis]PDS72425.1 YecA family protein [Rhizobium sp. L43]ULJ82393.1 YecA family protein [Rhizobium sp. C104]